MSTAPLTDTVAADEEAAPMHAVAVVAPRTPTSERIAADPRFPVVMLDRRRPAVAAAGRRSTTSQNTSCPARST